METLSATLAAIVGERRVLQRPSALIAYTSDGLPGYHQTPSLAVFPGTRDELIAVVRALSRAVFQSIPGTGGTLSDDLVQFTGLPF